ncbi:tetratricopeptide repeat protein [Patescibacteria group bacterium]|nr:tetratricopeptide repeat protein [Patescibacteria group bacterium]
MESSKRDKLINLRERENVRQDDEEIISVKKKESSFFQKAPHRSMELTDSEIEKPASGLKSKFLNKVKRSARKASQDEAGLSDSARGVESTDNTPLKSPQPPFIKGDALKRGISAMEPAASKIGEIFDKAIRYLLYFLVFLLPIFVLPFSVEIYEFNKVLLLFFISSSAFLLWLIKMILIDRRLTFVKTPLDLPIIIFISIALISTVFSVDKVSSILGFYGRFSDSLMVYLSLAMLYFVGVNCAARSVILRSDSDEESQNDARGIESLDPSTPLRSAQDDSSSFTNNLIKAFLASAFVAAIAGLIYFFGFKFIPWEEAQFRSFNLVGGSLNVFGVYLTAVILIALGYRSRAASAFSKHLTTLLIVMSLILLMFVDFVLAWIVLAISLFAVLVLGVALRFHSPEISGTMEPAIKTRQRLVSTGLIFLVSLVFIASSLTIVNKRIQPDAQFNSEAIFTESLISKSIKNRLADSSNGNQIAREDAFTREVILDKKTAVSIVVEGAKKDLFAGVIGSGPGTYLYNFSKFKPAEFNNNAFWNIRFDKAGSEILEKVSTVGILGTLSYLLIVILAMGMFLKMLLKIPPTPFDKGGNLYIFSAWFGLLLFQFMYLEATTTKFIFWLLTIILVAEYVAVKRFHSPNGTIKLTIINLKKDRSAFYSSLGALLIFAFILVNSYSHQFKFYQAEAGYKNVVLRQNKALKTSLTREQIWEVLNQNVSDMEKSVERNSQRGDYKIYLSDIYFNRATLAFQEEIGKGEDEKDTQRIALEVKNAIDYAKSAADASPNNIVFQQKLAIIYNNLDKNIGVDGAKEWAVKKYLGAIKLEPANPVLNTELGKIYISANETDAAIGEFEKALSLKENYLDAGLQLGLAYEIQGNSQKAISQLISLGSVERIDSVIAAGQVVSPVGASLDIDAAFQLGRIYYNEGRNSKAKNLFLKIAKINSTHSNARYSLGLIYEKEGEYELALREFEIVSAMNPGNEEVTERVDKLKKIVEKENKKPEPVLEPIVEEESVEDGTGEEE